MSRSRRGALARTAGSGCNETRNVHRLANAVLHRQNRWRRAFGGRKVCLSAVQTHSRNAFVTSFAIVATAGSWISARRNVRFFWFSSIVGSALLLLAPAIWNGFPFLFYDSGAYIELAIQGGFRPERSAFYAYFLSAFWPKVSIWPAISAQVLLTVLVMAEFARVLAPGISPGRFFLIVAALWVGTGLPWNAADILPDILAPLLVLCLYLLGFHADRLSWPHKAALIAVATLAATAHASHLGLAAGLFAVIAVMQSVTRRVKSPFASPRWQLPALVFALSLASLVASNFALTGDVFVSRSGPAFLFARLEQDGIAKRLLDDTCPQSGYRLCPYKDDLPNDSNDYLWGWQSPFQKLGGFDGTADEAKTMIAESLKRYPWLNLKMAVLDTLEQFVTFKTGDGVEPLNDIPVPAMERQIPDQVELYLASRQRNGRIAFDWINAVQMPIGALAIIALAAILVEGALRRNWNDRVFLPAFVLLALFGNAFICGVFSSPHDRYQSRLIWLACFAVLLIARRRPGELPPRHLPDGRIDPSP